MRMNALFVGFGLMALAMGCGSTPQEDASAPQVQASPAQDMPSEQQLAETASAAPVTAVRVRYVVDPTTTTQLSVSAGAQKASDTAPSETLAPGAVRRPLR